jgi:hypothetical protein
MPAAECLDGARVDIEPVIFRERVEMRHGISHAAPDVENDVVVPHVQISVGRREVEPPEHRAAQPLEYPRHAEHKIHRTADHVPRSPQRCGPR